MKRYIVIVLALIIGGWTWANFGKTPVPLSPQPTVVWPDVFDQIARPAKLMIPSIAVDTVIESVGMDSDGRMAVPSSHYTVGWWSLGSKPGEVGSAVLAGHYDSPTGEAGVFYRLKELKVGDRIVINDERSRQYSYVVSSTAHYPDQEFPIDKIFADMSGRYLNLITCSGRWDERSQNYQDRYVVSGQLVQ